VDADLKAIRTRVSRSASPPMTMPNSKPRCARAGLHRARSDFSDHAEIDAVCAAGHPQDHRMEKAHRRHSAGRNRRIKFEQAAAISPPARTRSPSSATSPRTPTPTRGSGNGSARMRRPRDDVSNYSLPSLRGAQATKQSSLYRLAANGLLRCARNDGTKLSASFGRSVRNDNQ